MRILHFAFGLAAALAAEALTIQEWPVSYGGRVRDPFMAPDGKVWFVGQTGGYAAHFDTGNAQFQRLVVPSQPHSIIVDNFGRPWYTGNTSAHIGRIDPVTQAVQRFPTPQASDPHTMVFARDGGLWATAQNSDVIFRLDTATGTVDYLPTSAGSRPYGIDLAPDGTVWAVLFGTNKLARIDPVAKTLQEIALTRAAARPRRIGITSDGAIWYGDYNGGRVGRYDPETRENQDWLMPGGSGSQPYAMTVDHLDRLWLVATGLNPNRLVAFDSRTRTFVADEPLPGGANVVRHMVYHRPTRTIWYGTDRNTLGRAVVEAATPVLEAGVGTRERRLRLSGSRLAVTSVGPRSRFALYSAAGTRVLEIPLEGESLLPLEGLASGWYWAELRGPGAHWAEALRLGP
jgi:virginiamycin B lyase